MSALSGFVDRCDVYILFRSYCFRHAGDVAIFVNRFASLVTGCVYLVLCDFINFWINIYGTGVLFFNRA